MATMLKKAALVAALALAGLSAGEAWAKKPVVKKELSGTLNLNTATPAQLDALPGVGTKAVKRIVDARTKSAFKSPAEVASIKGFGKKKYERLKPYLSVSGPTTLVVKNAASGGSEPAAQGRAAPKK